MCHCPYSKFLFDPHFCCLPAYWSFLPSSSPSAIYLFNLFFFLYETTFPTNITVIDSTAVDVVKNRSDLYQAGLSPPFCTSSRKSRINPVELRSRPTLGASKLSQERVKG
uniref:Uncharacterized protein n=1 Tax=Cacopsylla melanoneura TaxID=428564 RepID=A0A8D9B1V0_9HEMI